MLTLLGAFLSFISELFFEKNITTRWNGHGNQGPTKNRTYHHHVNYSSHNTNVENINNNINSSSSPYAKKTENYSIITGDDCGVSKAIKNDNNSSHPLQSSSYCDSSEYVTGKWHPSSHSLDDYTMTYPKCCSSYHPLNDPHTCMNSMTPFGNVKGTYIGHSENGKLISSGYHGCGTGCRCGVTQYDWIPSNCLLIPWNASHFCALLNNRTFLMVGDSIMDQVASVLMNHVIIGGGGCESNLVYAPSDTLWNVSVADRGNFLRYYIEKTGAEIALVNANMHIYLRKAFRSIVENVLKEFKQAFNGPGQRRLKLIWRTEPSHGCSDHILEKLPSEINFWKNYSYGLYIYPEMESRDDFVRSSFKSVPNAFVLDLLPLLYRVDAHPLNDLKGHVDCGHSCIPGPLDWVPRFLLTLLITEEI